MRFILALASLMLFAGCNADSRNGIAPGPNTIVRMSDSEIKGLDPQKISDLSSLRIAADQFEGLTRLDARGDAEQGLAESWTVSDDGLEWRFRLRDKIIFSDGQPITAALFPLIFKRLRDEQTAAPAATLFANIQSVSADENNIIIRLSQPAPYLPVLMAHPAMAAIPLHLIKSEGGNWTVRRPLVTSGPYQLSTWRLNDHARLERNPNWHDSARPVQTIIWKPMDSSLSAMRLFLAKGADISSDYPESRHQWLLENDKQAVHSAPYLGAYYFAFNVRRKPFSDPRVRQALSMAVEREWIAGQVIGAGNIPAWSILPPDLADKGAYRPEWADWPRERRLEAARTLLAQAGYDRAYPLRFEIRFNSSAEHRRVSVALAAMWQPLGVEASQFNSEAALHFSALRSHDFALARSGWIADIPTPENFLAVHQAANGDGNYSGYDSAAYNDVLTEALGTSDAGNRAKLMRRADEILAKDAPVLPLYYYVTRNLVSPRIKGWQDNISNVHPSRTLRIGMR